MNERRKTFGADAGSTDDLGAGDFKPRPIARPDIRDVKRVAEADGFTQSQSGQGTGTQRRYRTGRTAQLNLKVTVDHKARFTALADSMNVSLNVAFERAVSALEKSTRGEP